LTKKNIRQDRNEWIRRETITDKQKAKAKHRLAFTCIMRKPL